MKSLARSHTPASSRWSDAIAMGILVLAGRRVIRDLVSQSLRARVAAESGMFPHISGPTRSGQATSPLPLPAVHTARRHGWRRSIGRGRGGGRLGLPHAAPEKQTCRGRAPDQGVRCPRAEDDRLFRRGQKKQTRKKEKDVSAHNIARAPFPPFALSQSASAARVAAMTAGWLRARNHAASQRAGQRANQPASFAANQPTQPGRPQARRGEAAIISAGRGVTPVRGGVESVMLRPEAGAELGKAWKKWGGGYSTRWQP